MRLWASQRSSCASSQTLAIVISSLAPGAAATKCWNAEEPRDQPQRRPAELAPEPLPQRRVRVDADRPEVLGELDLLLALHALAGERARDAVLLGDLADDRPAPARRGGEPERRRDGRLADTALARDVQQGALEQGLIHASDSMTGRRMDRDPRQLVRDVPAHAPPPRPDVLLGHAQAAGGDPARDARALRLRAHRRRDRRRPAPAGERRGAARGARRLGGGARARAGRRAARRTRSSARSSTPAAATGCRSASCRPTCARCGSTARPCGSRPGPSSRPTWTARPARSAASWRRCSACPSATTPATAGSGSRSSSRTSSATCARTRAWIASTCPRRTARASA